ncbi:MAG: hypothetical protein LC754_03545 [Acidobacteria bacterium]|nr:hypothetical protein [Acidobacteriota bacterium]
MSQLSALVWLKWKLFRNSLRSRKAVVGRVASALGTLAALALALVIATALGFATYAFMSRTHGDAGQSGETAYLFLLVIFVLLYLMWAIVPLGLGGGGQFDPGRMLLYPVSLGKLFVFDFLSELTSLSTIFAAPVIFGVALGAGLASGGVGAALVVALVAVVSGLSLSKLLSTAIGSLMRTKRTRGETVLAILGGVLGLSGAFVGQLAPVVARHADYFRGIRWTPPGAIAAALSWGLRVGGAGEYAAALATLTGYAFVFVGLAYMLARRTALGAGGGVKKRAAARKGGGAGDVAAYAGWQLPLMSAQLSAVVEKELRYALRNAQLRVIAVMATGLTIVLRLSPLGGTRRGVGFLGPYAEGAGAIFSVLYISTLLSPLTTNLFGYDGAGMRSLVLAPVDGRRLLVGKNIATTFISLLLTLAGVLAAGLVLHDLTWQPLLSAALSYVVFAALFALGGNWLSIHFPKRVQFGKRMNRSGVAGLIMVPFFVLLLVPPAIAVAGGYAAQSLLVKYVILAAFASLSIGAYLLLISRQGRSFERRELEILEAVTGQSGSEDGQIMG